MSSRSANRYVHSRLKTQVPAPAGELIERPRLMAQLSQAGQAKLVLVQAPAGYGKTSLLQQWSASQARAGALLAWFTPDPDDRSANALLGYLLDALAQAGHEVGELAPWRVRHETCAWKIIAMQLANSFVDASRRCLVFLDEVQHLRESEALQCLRLLIEATPPQVQFVLASREQPGIPLGRLRALGQLFELRTPQLRFTSDETARYFGTREGSGPSPAQVAALQSRTEGWIVGLKLLRMVARSGAEDAFSAGVVTGEHAELVDFFAEDVLERQDPVVQEFLLRTSVLERMCAPLCDALPGVANSRSLIERCNAAGLFVVGLDGTRTWFRYHALFAEFLRRRLHDRHPGLASQLYVAASRWLEHTGFEAEAFEAALHADDALRAAQILDAQCDALWSAGRQQDLQAMAERVPPHAQALFPRLMLAVAWRRVAQWRVDEARQLVAVSRARLAEMAQALGECAQVRSIRHRILHRESQIAHHLYQLEVMEQLSHQLLSEQVGDGGDPYLRASVLLTLQYARREQFRFEGLPRCIELAREALEGTGFAQGRVFFSAACGPSFAELGRVQDARRVLSEGLTLARQMSGAGSTLGAVVALPWAALLYACNEIEPAGELLEEYFRSAPTVGTVDELVAGWLTQSRLAQLRGDFAGALESLQEAHEFAERHSVQKLRLMVVAECVKLLLRMGCPDDAAVYARRRGLAGATDQTLLRGKANSADSAQAQAWCRLLATQDRVADALVHARRWRAHLAAASAVHSTLEWDLIVAELYALSGARRAALRTVAQALKRAAPAGFSRAFLDAGTPILALIEHLADCEPRAQDPADCFARELLSASQGSADCKAGAADAEWLLHSAVAGRLTTRELEILKLAGGGMLNKRISERLGLTEGTVKWYLQQVFDKLGVRERSRAAAKARQLGLIS